MPDRRETILAAMFTALQTVEGDGGVAMAAIERNPTEALPEGTRPALRMFDGDEVSANADARRGVRKAPQRQRMQPAIFGYVTGTAADVNALIARVRKAIFNNDTFFAALGADDVLTQDSLVTEFSPSASPEGNFGIHLDLEYSFKPSNP